MKAPATDDPSGDCYLELVPDTSKSDLWAPSKGCCPTEREKPTTSRRSVVRYHPIFNASQQEGICKRASSLNPLAILARSHGGRMWRPGDA